MVSRVTNQQAISSFVDQIFRQRGDLESARQRVATGIEIALPGDDPGRAGTIDFLHNTVTRLQKHQERITYARNFLEQQDATLGSAQDIVVRAKEIATQGASENMGTDERRILSEEVFALRDQLVNLANSQYQGVYIYGGADDDDPPFDQFPVPPPGTFVAGYSGPGYVNPATGGASFRYGWDREIGTAVTRSTQISDFETVRMNSDASVWEKPVAALERLGRALAGYQTLPDLPLNSPGTAAVPDGTGAAYTFPTDRGAQTAQILRSIDELEYSRTQVLTEQTSVGSRLNQIDQASKILTSVIDSTDKARADLQEADPFEAATKFSQLQNSFQALLASGAQINNLSLLDFL